MQVTLRCAFPRPCKVGDDDD